ncbi:HEAT repeat domain-containing protein [Persicimonas caeni]|uniref:HEAT repeat domain-containing protein n=1 Tax=Persicimonas caeni TaxID=2292766 RepID=A0A4Y6Q1Q6_PERCE|nr:HEAT repeat domain-containing protein [Persicimonas caeni]QDG54528.1 HEAT repeat domain-containing protein [Persicimonas caeni]QED35749.1 HEAT repeat domain-containing protein [Persicimonas caeni]
MGRKKLLAVLIVALTSAPALADARLSKDLKKELQGYVDTNVKVDDAEAKQAALLTQGRIGGRASRKAIEEHKEAKDKRVKIAASMGLMMAGDRRADNELVDQLKDDSQLYLTLSEIVTVLPDKQEAKLLARVIKKADDNRKRDVMRYAAQQHGELYEELLGDYLTDRDDKERAAAVEAALFTTRDEAADYAQKMVDSRRKAIRADGVKLAIGLTNRPGGSKKAVAALEDALGDREDAIADKAARHLVTLGNKKGVAHIVEKLGKAKEDDQKKELAEFLLQHDASVSEKAAKPLMESENKDLKALGWQLAATGAGDEMVEKAKELFSSTKYDERLIGIKALARTGNKSAISTLGRALFDGDKRIRLYGAKGLGRTGDAEALNFLKKAIGGERDREVKIAVIEAVSRIDDKNSLNLLRFQTTARDPQVKLAVVQGIRRLGQDGGVKALKVVQQDRNLDVKWQAFLTALELEPKQGLSQMKKALRKPPTGFMSDIEKLDADTRDKVVEYLLINGDTNTRAAAMSTARRIGEPMFDIYRKVVVDSDAPDNVRRMAVVALSEKRDPKDKSLFEKLVRKSDNKAIQHIAAWTLTEYATEDLEATFRGLLGHKDPAIKSIAAYGLAAVND